MAFTKLFEVRNGGDLSFSDGQEINEALAGISVAELPKIQLTNVKDYLEAAFAAGSVKPEHSLPLTELLEELRAEA